MGKILVAYATNTGTTADVARKIGEELEKSGDQVDVVALTQIDSIDTYEAVIIGAPMIMGWHREAVGFLKKHQQTLSQVPVALFMMAMSLTRTGETSLDGIPITIDEKLPQSPKVEGRLSFKEHYATVRNYLRPVLKTAPSVKPISVGFFGGRLDIYRLKWWQALFVMAIIQTQPGEKRNWEAICAWAGCLSSTLHDNWTG
ncbi:MAG: flavodoxin domain-containing protein [Anaerolineae bacterium]|nr:flavodoxin domain-containing protein [Anaerolineae bacterium]